MSNITAVYNNLNNSYKVQGVVDRLLPEYKELEDTPLALMLVKKVSLQKIYELSKSMEEEEKTHWYDGEKTKLRKSKVRALNSIDRLELIMIQLIVEDLLKPCLGTSSFFGITGDEDDNKVIKLLETVRERISNLGKKDFNRIDANHIQIATEKFNALYLEYANDKDQALMSPWVKEDIKRLNKFNKIIQS
jgi:hypothetical protein